MGVNESSCNRHRIIINYFAPDESSDLCDGNTIGFSASQIFSTPSSVGNSRPSTFCFALENMKYKYQNIELE